MIPSLEGMVEAWSREHPVASPLPDSLDVFGFKMLIWLFLLVVVLGVAVVVCRKNLSHKWPWAFRRSMVGVWMMAAFIALAVLAESALRIFMAGSTAPPFLLHPLYFWAPNPEIKEITFVGTHMHINSMGLRDLELPYHKPAGEIRVICLGDSIPFGQGVALEQTYPKVLERLLQATTDHKIVVINAAVPGYSISQSYYRLEELYAVYDPDIVCVPGHKLSISAEHLHNRETIASSPLLRKLQVIMYRSLTVQLLRKEADRMAGQPRLQVPEPDTPQLYQDPEYAVYFQRFAEFFRSHRLQAVFAAPAPPWQQSGDAQWSRDNMLRNLRDSAAAYGAFAFVELQCDLPHDQFFLAPHDTHLTPAGHASYARQIFQAMVREDLVGRVVRQRSETR